MIRLSFSFFADRKIVTFPRFFRISRRPRSPGSRTVFFRGTRRDYSFEDEEDIFSDNKEVEKPPVGWEIRRFL